MMGFKLIREMSKEELIKELVDVWTEDLNKQEIDALKRAVIKYRTEAVQKRLYAEADLQPHMGLLGWLGAQGYGDDETP